MKGLLGLTATLSRRLVRHTLQLIALVVGRAGYSRGRWQGTPGAWPVNVVSLSHVALPFPPDDPVYGALTIALGSLTRLRSNPFWGVIDQQLGDIVSADLARQRQ